LRLLSVIVPGYAELNFSWRRQMLTQQTGNNAFLDLKGVYERPSTFATVAPDC
jgi:hypothetical protein